MERSFLKFLETMTIAMEADDITTQTANEVRSAVGGSPITQTTETTDEDDTEDLEKVDDIFGFEEPEDGPSGNPEQDKEDGAEDLPITDDSQVDENGEESGEEDPNVTDGESTEEDQAEADTSGSDDLLFTKKNRIRDNLAQLYTIISGDIEIIVNSLTGINDMNTVHVINMVLSHLRNCKDYIYKTLTQNLTSLDYDELLQRYITLKRVYDICIEMFEKHFKRESKK